jgi:hypothetical protein
MFVPTYQSTLHHIPEDLDIYQHNCAKLKCCIHANTHMYMIIHFQIHATTKLSTLLLYYCAKPCQYSCDSKFIRSLKYHMNAAADMNAN